MQTKCSWAGGMGLRHIIAQQSIDHERHLSKGSWAAGGREGQAKPQQSTSSPTDKRRQIGVQDGCTNPDGTKGTNLEPNHQHCNVMSIANVYLFRKLSTAAGGTGGRGGGGRTQCGEKSAVREKRCGRPSADTACGKPGHRRKRHKEELKLDVGVVCALHLLGQ
jgi:hypothetical protein